MTTPLLVEGEGARDMACRNQQTQILTDATSPRLRSSCWSEPAAQFTGNRNSQRPWPPCFVLLRCLVSSVKSKYRPLPEILNLSAVHTALAGTGMVATGKFSQMSQQCTTSR